MPLVGLVKFHPFSNLACQFFSTAGLREINGLPSCRLTFPPKTVPLVIRVPA